MHIDHIAIWTVELEALKDFYIRYFKGVCNQKYVNSAKGLETYFISFDNGCRLELMRRRDIRDHATAAQTGLCHFALTCSDREEVRALTERLRADGYRIAGEPRTTGDGYFESIVADPDGNLVELTCD